MSEVITKVKYCTGDYEIEVKRTGDVLLTPVPGNSPPKKLEEYTMPAQQFWVALSDLIKSMYSQIEDLAKHNSLLEVEVNNLDCLLGIEKEKKSKIVLVGSSKKEMFAAGVMFGKMHRS